MPNNWNYIFKPLYMTTQIEQQMQSLRLHGMAQAWNELRQSRQLSDLSINDGLTLLLQAEILNKTNKRFDRLIKNARFRYQASMEEVICSAARNLDKSLIEETQYRRLHQQRSPNSYNRCLPAQEKVFLLLH